MRYCNVFQRQPQNQRNKIKKVLFKLNGNRTPEDKGEAILSIRHICWNVLQEWVKKIVQQSVLKSNLELLRMVFVQPHFMDHNDCSWMVDSSWKEKNASKLTPYGFDDKCTDSFCITAENCGDFFQVLQPSFMIHNLGELPLTIMVRSASHKTAQETKNRSQILEQMITLEVGQSFIGDLNLTYKAPVVTTACKNTSYKCFYLYVVFSSKSIAREFDLNSLRNVGKPGTHSLMH